MRDFPSNDDWKISPLKQRTVKELTKKAAKHNITYLPRSIYLSYLCTNARIFTKTSQNAD